MGLGLRAAGWMQVREPSFNYFLPPRENVKFVGHVHLYLALACIWNFLGPGYEEQGSLLGLRSPRGATWAHRTCGQRISFYAYNYMYGCRV